MENKVAKDMAEAEFERFAEAMDLEIDPVSLGVDDLEDFNKRKSQVIRQIERGNMVINDNGEAVYTPHRPASKIKDPLTFHERSGETLPAADGLGKNTEGAKLRRMIAQMCKVHPNVITGLSGTDIKVAETMFILLMV